MSRGNSSYTVNDIPRSHFRKPTIELKKFDGKNWSDWPELWDGFIAGIDNDSSLSDSEKLTYLKSLLEGEATNTIKGIRLTNVNYEIAVEILTKKYGRSDMVNMHVSKILNLKKVARSETKLLRKLLDKVDFHEGIAIPGKIDRNICDNFSPFILIRLQMILTFFGLA